MVIVVDCCGLPRRKRARHPPVGHSPIEVPSAHDFNFDSLSTDGLSRRIHRQFVGSALIPVRSSPPTGDHELADQAKGSTSSLITFDKY